MQFCRSILAILIIFFGQSSYSAQNLEQSDFIGAWVSNSALVKGEQQYLTIAANLTTAFRRTFEGKNSDQLHTSDKNAAVVKDDLLIVKYQDDQGALVYKLVLSGWRSNSTKVLYGTMFMYRKGKQYNGLPVSFNEK